MSSTDRITREARAYAREHSVSYAEARRIIFEPAVNAGLPLRPPGWQSAGDPASGTPHVLITGPERVANLLALQSAERDRWAPHAANLDANGRDANVWVATIRVDLPWVEMGLRLDALSDLGVGSLAALRRLEREHGIEALERRSFAYAILRDSLRGGLDGGLAATPYIQGYLLDPLDDAFTAAMARRVTHGGRAAGVYIIGHAEHAALLPREMHVNTDIAEWIPPGETIVLFHPARGVSVLTGTHNSAVAAWYSAGVIGGSDWTRAERRWAAPGTEDIEVWDDSNTATEPRPGWRPYLLLRDGRADIPPLPAEEVTAWWRLGDAPVAFQSDNADGALVLGTHDPVRAEAAYIRYLRDADDDISDPDAGWGSAARMWLDPAALRSEQDWTLDQQSDAERPGWIPYLHVHI